MLNAVADAAGKAVQAGIDAMEAEESKLRASVATYVDVETTTAGVFTETSGQLA